MGIKAFALLTLAALLAVLLNFGQPFWCACGYFNLWASDIKSSHTSQHFFDAYSFSHLQHGFIFYFILYRFFKLPLNLGYLFAAGILLESGWEVLENTSIIIDRYRSQTIAFNYYGDSIANSFGDVLSCFIGLFTASRLSWQFSLFLCILVELTMLLIIKDCLGLNILMLIYPSNAVRRWQE